MTSSTLSNGISTDLVRVGLDAVAGWVEAQRYRGYDPGDGDLSFLRHLTFGSKFLRRVLTAVILRTPFHIRPWIGIRPHTSTKGMGYMAWGNVKMFSLTGEPIYRQRAEHCFDWLMKNQSPGYEHSCWGNHFAFTTRAGTIARYTPTIVWSSLIGMAFLEGYDVLRDPRYLDIAVSVAQWIKSLPREITPTGTCLSYVPGEQSSIHNSNMLGAALLARVGVMADDPEARKLAAEAMLYSCTRQLPDGAWYYGEASKYHWIDNFHTGYNLDSLRRYIDATGDHQFDPVLESGFKYFRLHFVKTNGRPPYFHDGSGPIDIQCAAQMIDTLAFFSDRFSDALAQAESVARWTLTNMQAKDGHFYYRDLGWKKVQTPMFHWGQGTMFKALAHLLSKR